MNIATFSPGLVVLYVAVFLWILMDVHWEELSRIQKRVIPALIIFIAVLNHVLRLRLGAETYSPLIFFTMHIPFFFIFLHLTKCGILKMLFMNISEPRNSLTFGIGLLVMKSKITPAIKRTIAAANMIPRYERIYGRKYPKSSAVRLLNP